MTDHVNLERIRNRWRALRDVPAAQSRIASLSNAVRAHVRPGDTLYFGGSMARPNAAMFEVARAFWSANPGFTLAAPAIANQHAPLIRAGLVRRAVTSIHAMTFPTPGPHPLYIEAARNGTVAFESWSLMTLVMRLQAAALGLPFMPTTSLTGSDMAADLAAQGGYATATNPFSGEDVGVIAPLAPDVTFVHGLAADTAGNVLVCPPYYDAKWAALAAKRAVIATVETIVSPETIRRHAALVQIPAERITCVCEMPLGGHPNSVPGDLVPEVGGYTDDYDFLTDLRSAGATGEALDEWTAEWITGCPNHEAYLARLGSRRINELRGRARADGWQFELGELAAERKGTPASEAERHVVLATRALTERLSSGNLDAILAGLGVSSLAAWMAAIRMRENGHPIPLMVEAGMYGYLPAPADPFLFNYRNMFSGSMLSDVATILGVMTGGPGNRSIGVLGAAQVDRAGNLNTSRLPNLLLTGSGGANDIASSASEVVVTIGESPKRLVEKVDFITSPGRAVRMVVTPSAVFERRDADYVLTRAMPTPEENLAAAVERIRGRCSWAFECADDLVEEVEPDADEIELARLLDPQGLFLG